MPETTKGYIDLLPGSPADAVGPADRTRLSLDTSGNVQASVSGGAPSTFGSAGGLGVFSTAAKNLAFGGQPFDVLEIFPARDYANGNIAGAWGTTPVAASMQSEMFGSLYIGPGASGPCYLKWVGTGPHQAPISDATHTFAQMQAVCSQPWMIECYAMLNPVDIANSSGNGAIYLPSWSGANATGSRPTGGSGDGSPGRGNYGGFVGPVYRKGQLQWLYDISIASQIQAIYPVTFTPDLNGHLFRYWYDLTNSYISIDGGAQIAITDSALGMPQGGAFLMFGCDTGGASSSIGGYGMKLGRIRVALPSVRL